MALTVFKFVKGTPLDNKRTSNDKVENYEFAPMEIDGALEEAILAEAECWEMVCTRKEICDDDEYGKEETIVGVDRYPLPKCNGQYLVWNGMLVGFKTPSAIYFFPYGGYAGNIYTSADISWTSRCYEYESCRCALAKIKPSSQTVYYAEQDGNPYHTVYGVDPYAEEVVIQEGAKLLYCDVFKFCKVRSISLPASLEKITWSNYLSFEGANHIEKITVDENNPVFRAQGNCLIHNESGRVIAGGTSCVIPCDERVKAVGEFAFYRSNLRHIAIPENIQVIEKYAFGQSDVESIVLPKTPIKIVNGAFSYCSCLQTVYYRGTKEEWESSGLASEFRYKHIYTYSENKPAEEGRFWHYGENGEIAVW